MKKCEQYQMYISALLDNELDDELQQQLFFHLTECETCRQQYNEMQKLKEETLRFKQDLSPPVDVDYFWDSFYNRLERKLSWFLVLLGSVTLMMTGLFITIKEVLISNNLSVPLKIAILVMVTGGLLLATSVLREKLFVKKSDKFRKVKL
ncbi:MAG: hypothetical protein Kow00108_10370 [Calditrichia bacterium]